MFKVGDAVRVKAGSPVIEETNTSHHPWRRSFGKKLTIKGISKVDRLTWAKFTIDIFSCDYLEPWNDAEEWDGWKWVPKKKADEAKPCVVFRKGYSEHCTATSTNQAFRIAEAYAEKYPGTEYVVYQEKGSRKVEKKSKAEKVAEVAALTAEIELTDGSKVNVTTDSVSVHGDMVRVIYKVNP